MDTSRVLSKGRPRLKADELRNWLDRHNYSQRDLARLVGVNERSVRSWVLNERRVPLMMNAILDQLELQLKTGDKP